MTILSKSREFTKIEEYLLTHGNNNLSVKDLMDGDTLNVTGYLCYTDMKGDEEVELYALMTDSNRVYVTQSKTFFRSLKGMFDTFAEDYDVIPIRKISGKSKAGREYVDCELVVESL